MENKPLHELVEGQLIPVIVMDNEGKKWRIGYPDWSGFYSYSLDTDEARVLGYYNTNYTLVSTGDSTNV